MIFECSVVGFVHSGSRFEAEFGPKKSLFFPSFDQKSHFFFFFFFRPKASFFSSSSLDQKSHFFLLLSTSPTTTCHPASLQTKQGKAIEGMIEGRPSPGSEKMWIPLFPFNRIVID
jgi:hypothetical protein